MAGGRGAALEAGEVAVFRYERDAWRRYRESMKEVQATRPAPEPVVEAPPAPAVVPPPRVEKPPVAPSEPSFEEQRRALLALAAPYKRVAIAPLIEAGMDDEDAWLDALEARIEAATRLQPSVTERTHPRPRPEATPDGFRGHQGLEAGPEKAGSTNIRSLRLTRRRMRRRALVAWVPRLRFLSFRPRAPSVGG